MSETTAADPSSTPSAVTVGELLSPAAHVAASRLLAEIWGTEPSSSPMAADLLTEIVHAGGSVLGASADGRLLGVAVSVAGPPASDGVYGLIAGVARDTGGRGIGYRLKQAQRRWALDRGARTMRWTYDPLIRRNAHFNIARLGARVTEYVPDFYPPMNDAVNRNDPTDRFVVCWDLVDAAGPGALPDDGPAVLSIGPGGGPQAGPAPDGGPFRVLTPPDIEALRLRDPAAALAWREAQRDALRGALDRGLVVAGFTREGAYLLSAP